MGDGLGLFSKIILKVSHCVAPKYSPNTAPLKFSYNLKNLTHFIIMYTLQITLCKHYCSVRRDCIYNHREKTEEVKSGKSNSDTEEF